MHKFLLPIILMVASCATQPVVTTGPLDAPAATRRYADPGTAPAVQPKPAPVHGGKPGFQNIETAQ
jgi:hypothetical protein